MSISRQRLNQSESRSVALEAARRILIDKGPQAVTLKAVAAEIGRTHANLLHHFGSAAGLQAELARTIADRVNAAIAEAVQRFREGRSAPKEIVDLVFDAFDREGAGALAAWMILNGNKEALNPVLGAIHDLVDRLAQGQPGRPVPEVTLSLILGAVGDSLLGQPIAQALGLPGDAARRLALETLVRQLGC
ncbi:TetR/AcrR family transcriptional regulator [Sphingomonas piscis]|uniref:TetR/AcrR family transcriptional regulator n=1 Tax=Sphingomonas piscis TaxID=2714943 RepID=A0A6G7YNZ2_9SPHN|nr:TetR/AcrR family transcriptional regulator [Sphingomonas piscis]QIK78446.1 TetR/AcrR family transcriptional regulator [Sphingomonas piscis]